MILLIKHKRLILILIKRQESCLIKREKIDETDIKFKEQNARGTILISMNK